MTCEVFCSHTPSVVADCHQLYTILLQQTKKQILSSTSPDSTATMKSWKKKKTNATFGIDEKGFVHFVLLQILGGDGRSMIVTAVRKSDRSFIGAFLPDLFSEIYQFFFYLSHSSEDGQ